MTRPGVVFSGLSFSLSPDRIRNMIEFPLGYREVVPDQTLPEKWKEITLNTGESSYALTSAAIARQSGISLIMSHENV